jgi:colanic acid biosynthesis glycosyl transferase WcaI
LTVLPFQPMGFYPEVLGTGDILLAVVEAEAARFSVPSKILSYLAAGKPIVASIAPDNDAAATIAGACSGIVTAPGEVKAFVEGVLKLADDRKLSASFGRNARAFAESQFDINSIADRFEQVFATITRPISRRQALAPAEAV